jgi:hypothetical protein
VLGQADLGSVRGGLRQEREDAAAVVVDEHDRGGQVVQLRGNERVEIVEEGQVADDEDDRTDVGRRRPERGRNDAVDAVRAPVRQRADRPLRGRQPVVEVADRHAVAGPQQRPVGQRLPQDREREPLEGFVALDDRCQPVAERLLGDPVRKTPFIGPGRGRPPSRRQVHERVRERFGRRRRIGLDEGRRHDRRLAPGSIAVDDDLGRRTLADQREHRLRGRRRAEPEHEVRRVAVDPCAGPDEMVGMGEDARPIVGPTTHAGQGIGGDREPARGGEAGQRRRQRWIVLRAGHDQATLDLAETRRERFELVRGEHRGARHHVAERVGPGARVAVGGRTAAMEGRVGHERLPERQVQVHRPGRGAARGCHCPRDDRPNVPARLGFPVEQRQLGEPADVAAEDADLVDRLGSAAFAQLGRAVRGEHHERDTCQRGLDDRRQQVRDRRPGRDEDGYRRTRRARQAQREVARRPLVEEHPHP